MAETLATEAAGLFCSKAAFWLPVHQSNLSPWAVHPPLSGWAAVQFTLVAFQRKTLSLENALGSFKGEARAFRSPGSHSEDQVHAKDAASAPMHKNQRVTLLQPVAHLDLPTDRKKHLGLRASPLTEELSHCKIKATPCPQDRGNLEISGLQEEIWSPNKIQQGFPQSA